MTDTTTETIYFIPLAHVASAIDGDLLRFDPFKGMYLTAGDQAAADKWGRWTDQAITEVKSRHADLEHVAKDISTQAQWKNKVNWKREALQDKLRIAMAYRMMYEMHRKGWCPTPLFQIRMRKHFEYLLKNVELDRYYNWTKPNEGIETDEYKAMVKCGLHRAPYYAQARQCITRLELDAVIFIDSGPVPVRSSRQRTSYDDVETYKLDARRYHETGRIIGGFETLGPQATLLDRLQDVGGDGASLAAPTPPEEPRPQARPDPKPKRKPKPEPDAPEEPKPEETKHVVTIFIEGIHYEPFRLLWAVSSRLQLLDFTRQHRDQFPITVEDDHLFDWTTETWERLENVPDKKHFVDTLQTVAVHVFRGERDRIHRSERLHDASHTPTPQPPPPAPTPPPGKRDVELPLVGKPDENLADRMKGWGDKMNDQIAKLRSRHEGKPMTRKRATEREQGRIDARKLEREQTILFALASHWRDGSVPVVLARVKTKTAIRDLAVLQRAHEEGWADKFKIADYDTLGRARIDDTLRGDVLTALQAIGATQAGQGPTRATMVAEDKLAALLEQVELQRPPGYFCTPEFVARRMLDLARIMTGDRILEPSAGSGALLDAVVTTYDPKLYELTIHAIEINARLREILQLKGYGQGVLFEHSVDFMEAAQARVQKPYDVILMNPPFENGADMDHVCRAFEFWLADGGRLVAIMGSGAFSNSTRKHQAFQSWFGEHGGKVQKLDPDAFRESGTMASAVLVTLTRPK